MHKLTGLVHHKKSGEEKTKKKKTPEEKAKRKEEKRERKKKQAQEPVEALPEAQPSGDDRAEDPDNNQEDRKKLWSRASGLIGKDTTSLISLPVSMFEPLSVLQSMCEPLRYASMLDRLATTPDPIDRLCILTTFCIALFGGYNRTVKPFNPTLGETFEYVAPDNNFKCLCEQVSHHPPIGVAHTTARGWTLQQESKIETKFWGNTVDVYSIGANNLHINATGEDFTWTNPLTCIHNIIFGRIWVEPNGSFPLKNATTGDSCIVHYKKAGWFDGINYNVNGEVKDKDGRVRALVSGKYNESIYITKIDHNGRKSEPVMFWEKQKEEITNRWKWPAFLFQLTATDSEYDKILPPTDSRLRGDVRALKAENMKLAGREKSRIEELQRVQRKERDAQAVKWNPAFFKKNDKDVWEYHGDHYWVEREERIKKVRENPNAAPVVAHVELSAHDDEDDDSSDSDDSDDDVVTPR